MQHFTRGHLCAIFGIKSSSMDWMEWPNFLSASAWMSILSLTFLEIVLGIDNLLFISLTTMRVPAKSQRFASIVGLSMAMLLRIALLFAVGWLMVLDTPLLSWQSPYIEWTLTGKSLILLGGGLFLLYQSVKEIHIKIEGRESIDHSANDQTLSVPRAILDIVLLNAVFSIDSILTAVGMTTGMKGAMFIMVFAVVISMILMMVFITPINQIIQKHPTLQMLGLAFLLLIGFMLVLEGAHASHLEVFGKVAGPIPKGYLYFAIFFSLGVEILNLRIRKRTSSRLASDTDCTPGQGG